MPLGSGAYGWSFLFGALWMLALVTAWRSADRVVRENRPWTRAWRIVVACIGLGIGGVFVPFGAAYVVVKYHRALRATPRRTIAV